MDEKEKSFAPSVKAVWNKDCQCDYFIGTIIDGNNKVVFRSSQMRSNRDAALKDATEALARSPFRKRYTDPEIRKKLEEYRIRRAEEEKRNAVAIYDPGEEDGWEYIYDPRYGGSLYRCKSTDQKRHVSKFLSEKHYDIKDLPGHKDIWKISSVFEVSTDKNQDSKITIGYQLYSNLSQSFKKHEKKNTIVIKRKWSFYDELIGILFGIGNKAGIGGI